MPDPSLNKTNEELNTAKQVQLANVGALTRDQLTPEAAAEPQGHDVPGHDHAPAADTAPDAHAAHQTPIAVDLPILLANRMAQVHAPSEPCPQRKKIPKVVTTCQNQPLALPKPLIRLTPLLVEPQKPTPHCASWARWEVLRPWLRQGVSAIVQSVGQQSKFAYLAPENRH